VRGILRFSALTTLTRRGGSAGGRESAFPVQLTATRPAIDKPATSLDDTVSPPANPTF
jgi:hypothetical protein